MTIRAKHYQQQPPNPQQCKICGNKFNTKLRLVHHLRNPTKECHIIAERISHDG